MGMNKTLQCKHIPTKPILEFLFQRRKEGKMWCCWMDSHENSIGQAMPPDIPGKLKRAKMQGLIERGLVSGCACGCRGDFEITKEGIKHLLFDLN